jgi:hypothetical protein
MGFTWCRRRRSCVSSQCLIYLVSMILRVYDLRCCVMPLGAPLPGFIYATRLEFYKCSSRIRIRAAFIHLQVIFESLYLSTSIMGRTQYTNPWVPEGHTHVKPSLFLLSVFFCFVCHNKWLDHTMFVLERDTLYFHCLEHSSFQFYRSTSVLFF